MASESILGFSDAISDSSEMFLAIPDESLIASKTGGSLDVFVVRREFSYKKCFKHIIETKREEREIVWRKWREWEDLVDTVVPLAAVTLPLSSRNFQTLSQKEKRLFYWNILNNVDEISEYRK